MFIQNKLTNKGNITKKKQNPRSYTGFNNSSSSFLNGGNKIPVEKFIIFDHFARRFPSDSGMVHIRVLRGRVVTPDDNVLHVLDTDAGLCERY